MQIETSFPYSQQAATAPHTTPAESILQLYNQQFYYYSHI